MVGFLASHHFWALGIWALAMFLTCALARRRQTVQMLLASTLMPAAVYCLVVYRLNFAFQSDRAYFPYLIFSIFYTLIEWLVAAGMGWGLGRMVYIGRVFHRIGNSDSADLATFERIMARKGGQPPVVGDEIEG